MAWELRPVGTGHGKVGEQGRQDIGTMANKGNRALEFCPYGGGSICKVWPVGGGVGR